MSILACIELGFGRDKVLLSRLKEAIETCNVHEAFSNVDLNRTWLTFSGEAEALAQSTTAVISLVRDLDLSRLPTSMPRTGVIDRVLFSEEGVLEHLGLENLDIPVVFVENSATRPRDGDIARWQHGGFGVLLEEEINADLGPNRAHPSLGIVLAGVRRFQLTVTFEIEALRREALGNFMLALNTMYAGGFSPALGMEFESYPLPTSQTEIIFLRSTLVDERDVDPVIQWIQEYCAELGIRMTRPTVLGALRPVDLPGAGRVSYRECQLWRP